MAAFWEILRGFGKVWESLGVLPPTGATVCVAADAAHSSIVCGRLSDWSDGYCRFTGAALCVCGKYRKAVAVLCAGGCRTGRTGRTVVAA